MPEQTADLCYPVLTPFKFRGVVVKPPAFVQMSADEARIYHAAGVLGGEDEAALTPEGDDDTCDESLTTEQVVKPAVTPAAVAEPAASTKPAATAKLAATAAKAPAKKATTKKASK